ncbi:hypothetical protein M9434_003126 [Picochlorum sp. BPE23]|nr:hypothetical protein M9434_003126 [Picochlorum sp. BPE23]
MAPNTTTRHGFNSTHLLLLMLCLSGLATYARSETEIKQFSNLGGPPNIQGVWQGNNTYAAFVSQSGTAFALTTELANGTTMTYFGLNRFTSWECTGVKPGQTRVLMEEIEVSQYGIVVELRVRCDMYGSIGDNQWTVITGDGATCPDPSADPDYVNTRIEGSTAIPVGQQVCNGQDGNIELWKDGPKFTGNLDDFVVGQGIGTLTIPVTPNNDGFPPVLSSPGMPAPFLGGVYFINNSTSGNSYFTELGYNVRAGSVTLTMYNSSTYQLGLSVPGTHELVDSNLPGLYSATYSGSYLDDNGEIPYSGIQACAEFYSRVPETVYAVSSITECPTFNGAITPERRVGTVKVV